MTGDEELTANWGRGGGSIKFEVQADGKHNREETKRIDRKLTDIEGEPGGINKGVKSYKGSYLCVKWPNRKQAKKEKREH